jgi:predicted transcriptional regulator
MRKDAQLTIRIRSGLKAELERLARAEDRSVAYIAERILRAHVEDKAAEREAGGKGRAGRPK